MNLKITKCIYVYVGMGVQSCLTLHNPMDYSMPGSSFHGIFQVRMDLPDLGIKFMSSVLQAISHHWDTLGSPHVGIWSKWNNQGVNIYRETNKIWEWRDLHHLMEKEMATHSSVLAWRNPGTGKHPGLPSMGLHRVRLNWSDLAAAVAASY